MVSVCIATYNGEKYIKEQLGSILSQLGETDEVIISDDGSTDDTLSIIQSFEDPRIAVYHHKKGDYPFPYDYVTHNFEHALMHTKGDFIFLADQDDYWLPGKVEKMTNALKDALLVVSNCQIADGELNIIHASYFKTNKSRKNILYNIIHNSYIGSCMAFNRALLNIALPFPESAVAHDIWLGLIARRYGKVAFLEEPLSMYRRHGSNLSAGVSKSPYSLKHKILYRMLIVKELLKLKRKTKHERINRYL